MSTADTDSPKVSEWVEAVDVSRKDEITFHLTDGRRNTVPLSWSWRLMDATDEQLQNYRIRPSGYDVHWPDVDEDISARGMLRGIPAPRRGTSPPVHSPSEWTAPRIKRLRKSLNMSQAELSKRMGVARQATIIRLGNRKARTLSNGKAASRSN